MFVFTIVFATHLLPLTKSESFISKGEEPGIITDSFVLNMRFFGENTEETNKKEHIRTKRQIRPNAHSDFSGFHSFSNALPQTMGFIHPEIYQGQHFLTQSIPQPSTLIRRQLHRQPPLAFINPDLQHTVSVPFTLPNVDQSTAHDGLNQIVLSPLLNTNDQVLSSAKTSMDKTISLDKLMTVINKTLKLLKDNDISVTFSNSNSKSPSSGVVEDNIRGQIHTVDNLINQRQRGNEDARIMRTSSQSPTTVIHIVSSDSPRQNIAPHVPAVQRPFVQPIFTNIPQTQLAMTQPLALAQPFVTGLLPHQAVIPTAFTHSLSPVLTGHRTPSSMESNLPWLLLGALALG